MVLCHFKLPGVKESFVKIYVGLQTFPLYDKLLQSPFGSVYGFLSAFAPNYKLGNE